MLGSFTDFSCAGNSGYSGAGSSNHFPMPWLDYTSTAVPRSFSDLLDWSEHMFIQGTEIHEIFKRLFNYFNTDVEVNAIDSDKQSLDDGDSRTWKTLLDTKLKWNVHNSEMWNNVATYGNDFISVVAPIKRYLKCDRCQGHVELEIFAQMENSEFKYDKGKFVGRCQSMHCKRNHSGTAEMTIEDMRIKDPDKFKIKHWPVREIALNYYMWTDETQVFWKIPEEYKRQVAFGDIKTLATADLGVLDSIRQGVLFKFKPDRVYHAKEPVLSGLKTKGWGLPRTLYLCRQAWTLQLIRKQVQALGIDFITPMRIVMPSSAPGRGSTGMAISPNMVVNHGDFSRMFNQARNRHRQDPTTVQAFQYPIEYQLIGGEASQLFPVDIHRTAKEDLLEAGGFPISIYKADITMQAAPVGLRLFEAQNRSIVSTSNDALAFVANRVSELSGRDPIEAKHGRVTLVDNIETNMAKLQMAMSGQTSMTNALKPLSMNFQEEARQNARDQAFLQQLQMEQQETLANQQGGMQMIQQAMQPQDPNAAAQGQTDPNAGMLPSNGLQIPEDLQGMEAAVSSLAQTLAQSDPATRQRELGILRQANPTAHGLLRTRLDQTDNQMKSEGRQMLLQQGAAPQ